MSYLICEIEVTQPLSDLQLSGQQTGVALIVRRKDRPIGLVMQALSPGATLSSIELSTLIAKNLGAKLLQESVAEELSTSTSSTVPFPSLTVAICTKDRPENVRRCLRSLLPLQQSASDDAPQFEVLVIDNAPSDAQTRQVVDGLPTIRYACEPMPGLDFARNRAIAEASGELLAFLDDDVVVDRGWLNGLKEAWTENPDAAAFTGLVLPYELETEAQILFEQRGGFRRGFEKIRYGQVLPGNLYYPCGAGTFGAGCNMMFKRTTLVELGGFDEALDTGAPLPGGGDLDMFYRVVRAGHALVYEPSYLVYHQHRREYEKLRRQYWTWGLGFMAFVAKAYRTDPPQRANLRGVIGWWLKDEWKQLKLSLRGRNNLPPEMILAEIGGGIQGLFGEYSRSMQRVEHIRRQFIKNQVSS